MLDETKLFDFIKIMFTRPSDFAALKKHSKKRHHFMVNRFFAIKFPTNANAFNFNGIDGSAVVESWGLVASRFKSVPAWIYTKTKKNTKTNKKEADLDPVALEFYMHKNEIGAREIQEMLRFCPDLLLADLEKIKKQIDVY